MFRILILILIFCGSSSVSACEQTRPGPLEIISDASDATGRNVMPYVYFENVAGRGIRTIDGHLFFSDVLGVEIGMHTIKPDVEIDENGTHIELLSDNLTRLKSIKPDDLIIELCVLAVVYSDGAIERFDE